MDYEKIILVTRKTRLESLVERFNTRAQARFYLAQNAALQSALAGPVTANPALVEFERLEQEHETYQAALVYLRRSLAAQLKLHEIERAFLPNFLFSPADIVVTVGIDGLVVNTAKYLRGQPVVAVNPDPAHIDGVLLPFTVDQAAGAVRQVLRGREQVRPISMAEARLSDGQSLLAFNDLFIGMRGHRSARYRIRHRNRHEDHSSSGVIVSTGAGSTGWLSSIFNMAQGIFAGFSGQSILLPRPELNWESQRLVYVVREPFASKSSGASLVAGMVELDAPLLLESHMPEDGVIFSDGVEADFLSFNAGAAASIHLSGVKTRLVTG